VAATADQAGQILHGYPKTALRYGHRNHDGRQDRYDRDLDPRRA
jgi:hypothetical protein